MRFMSFMVAPYFFHYLTVELLHLELLNKN